MPARPLHYGDEINLQPSIVISANRLWNLVNFRGGLIRALAAAGVEVVLAAPRDVLPPDFPGELQELPMDRSGMNPFADSVLTFRYARLLRAIRPRAMLSFTIKPNIYGALAARMTGVPSIANVSGLGTAFIRGGLFSRFVSALYRLAFAGSHAVFFQNPDDLDLFLSRGIVARNKARLLPGSGINLERFEPAKPLESRAPIFLFIGRLLADKGVREFVEAARLTRKQFPAARFQLLGGLDPENRTAIAQDELNRWVVDGDVEYLGPADDVRPFISKASAIVLPSYREGLPRSLLEGAAMARPLIATDVPGCREIVKDGVTGLLCQVRSGASLAEAMARFAAMGVDRRQALGEAARRMVEAEYDERIVIDAYLEVLKPLIGIEKK
jgi:glycosyltransferase involved in cell wall biosynthesis